MQVCNTNIRVTKGRFQDKLTFVSGMDNMGVIEHPEATKADKLAAYDRVTDLLAPEQMPYVARCKGTMEEALSIHDRNKLLGPGPPP